MLIAKKMLDAMTYRGNRLVLGLMMGRASYCHSIAYGLSRIEAMQGAVEVCWKYWRKPEFLLFAEESGNQEDK